VEGVIAWCKYSAEQSFEFLIPKTKFRKTAESEKK
jgi:hypothetical protein